MVYSSLSRDTLMRILWLPKASPCECYSKIKTKTPHPKVRRKTFLTNKIVKCYIDILCTCKIAKNYSNSSILLLLSYMFFWLYISAPLTLGSLNILLVLLSHKYENTCLFNSRILFLLTWGFKSR